MKNNQRGFTLTELTLAIAFIAMLVLAIAYVTIHAGRLYEKGMTVQAVNQMGREIIDSMRRDMMQAGSRIKYASGAAGENRSFRLCLNGVSYISNSATLLNNNSTKVTYNGQPISMMRIVDPAMQYCTGDPIMTIAPTQSPLDLLRNDATKLAVHDFTFTELTPTNNKDQSLYKLTMIIGTNDKGAVEMNKYCMPNSSTNAQANFTYCSIAEFSTIIRTGGTGE